MSFKVFFELSTGITNPINVPRGTYVAIMKTIANTERELGIERETYNEEVRWDRWPLVKRNDLTDEQYCRSAEAHNREVQRLYRTLAEWSGKPATDKTEELTPEMAKSFWLGLSLIDVPPERWTRDYYRARMEEVYETLRGRPKGGMMFDSDALTEQQAADVINLFSQWLDVGDLRLDVVKGDDTLTSSYDGGHSWCSGCGAVRPEDMYDPDDEDDDGCDEYCVECRKKRNANEST